MKLPRTCLVIGLLAACAPAQQRLLIHHRYEDALTRAANGDLDGGEVLAAIERTLEPGLHLQAVPAAELRDHLGGDVGVDDVVLVRVVQGANQIPLQRLEVALSLLHRSTLLPPIEPDLPGLAAIAGEAAGVVRPRPLGFLERIGRVREMPVDLIHAGHRPPNHVAATLHTWLQTASCSPGQACRSYLLWPRPQLGGQAPLELAVSVTVGGRGDAAILYRLAIPPGALEGGLQAMFGDRERTLDDLHRRHGRARVVLHPLNVLAAGPRGGFTHASRAALGRHVLGTRTRPGLRAHPGLRFRIDPDRLPAPDGQPGSSQVGELRRLLLSLGVSEQQIEVVTSTTRAGPEGGLQVQYELPLAPQDPGA